MVKNRSREDRDGRHPGRLGDSSGEARTKAHRGKRTDGRSKKARDLSSGDEDHDHGVRTRARRARRLCSSGKSSRAADAARIEPSRLAGLESVGGGSVRGGSYAYSPPAAAGGGGRVRYQRRLFFLPPPAARLDKLHLGSAPRVSLSTDFPFRSVLFLLPMPAAPDRLGSFFHRAPSPSGAFLLVPFFRGLGASAPSAPWSFRETISVTLWKMKLLSTQKRNS